MQNRDEDTEPTAAEQAFDALRGEVAAMRHAVTSLPDMIQRSRPADTTETLGAIAKKLESVASFLARIEQHPAIRMTPTQYNQAMAAAGDTLIHKAVRELDSAKAAAVEERRELVMMIGTTRGKWKQWEWLAWTGIATFILGVVISPMCARALPFGWDGQVAAFIMNGDRWGAGSALMQAQNPDAWNVLMAAGKLTADNSASLGACCDAAAKTKKEQHCSIVVPAQ